MTYSLNPARPIAAWLCAALIGAALTGCSPRSYHTVESGKETIYAFLNTGEPKPALALLTDVWDLGPRSKPVHIGPITWMEDPFHDSYWRFIFYSLRPTSNLLWAYYASQEPRYRDKLIDILRSFVAHDKVRKSEPGRERFDNRHTSAFRAMVLVNCFFKLRRSGDLPGDLEVDLLESIRKLGVFLLAPINYEGGHNHGFTEAAALLLMAENLPELDGAAEWRTTAVQRLDRLMVDTVDPDGVQIEDSPFYHFYVLAFAWEIDKWARAYDAPVTDRFRERTAAMIRYAKLVIQPDGHVPLLGASVQMDARKYREDVFGEVELLDPQFAYVRAAGATGQEPTERSVLFPSSGLAIMRSGFGPQEEFPQQTHILFDTGAYRTTHSQLDGLSFIYYSAGKTLLADSGLFTYDKGEEFDYFKSTRAHNTVVVDGGDQQPGEVRAGLHEQGATWSYQSGSHGLYDGVLHRRAVLLLQRDLTLVVDALGSTGAHVYEQSWHLFPSAELQRDGLDVVALDDGRPALRLQQAWPEGLGLNVARGDSAPLQGWYSEIFGKRVPNYALGYRATGPEAWFVTLVSSGPYAQERARLAARRDGERLHVSVCAGAAQLAVDIDHLAGDGETAAVATAPGDCQQ